MQQVFIQGPWPAGMEEQPTNPPQVVSHLPGWPQFDHQITSALVADISLYEKKPQRSLTNSYTLTLQIK